MLFSLDYGTLSGDGVVSYIQNRVCVWYNQIKFSFESICNNCSDGVKEDCLHPQCITGDGFAKGVMSINRKVPGPPINVSRHVSVTKKQLLNENTLSNRFARVMKSLLTYKMKCLAPQFQCIGMDFIKREHHLWMVYRI
jgi:hypothetical protein